MDSDEPHPQIDLTLDFEVQPPGNIGKPSAAMDSKNLHVRDDRCEAALIYDASLSSTASLLGGGEASRTGPGASGPYETDCCGVTHSGCELPAMGHARPQAETTPNIRLGFEMATDRIEIDLFGSTRKYTLSKQLAENVSKVTFPYFDPEKLKGIKLDFPFPVEQSMFLPPSPCVVSKTEHTSTTQSAPGSTSNSRPNNQLVHVSHCKKQARLARQQILFKIGMRSHLSENKKMLAAVQAGDIAKVSEMLHNGVSANVSDQKKRTPLHIAASQGHFAIASLLLAMHGEPNNQDILGNTPLHLAVCRGDRQIVKQLIENGGNIHLQDNTGRTPLSIVKARLNTLRKNRSISTEKLKGEFLLMWDFLKLHENKTTESETVPVADLCNMMENISTREQADEIADVMINKMSELCLVNQL